MALAISPASARERSARRGAPAWVLLSLLCSTAPAFAVEQVYIWRDHGGTVRFSAIEESDRRTAERPDEAGAVCRDEKSTAVIVTDAGTHNNR